MTIKWVQQDPLVMNGEPSCYGSRLTVRQLLELRANGYDLTRILTDHPELRRVGVAAASRTPPRTASATPTSLSAMDRSPPGIQPGRGGRPACPVPTKPGVVVKPAREPQPAAS